jgi:hypothetical protein
MKNQKKHCGNVYNRYKKLKGKITLPGFRKQLGRKCQSYQVTAQYIKDIEEIKKVKKELEEKKCLDYLSDNQLIELYEDKEFSSKVAKIIAERKIN